MANKKFYGKNKNKNSRAVANKAASAELEKYSAEQLSLTLEELGLIEKTRELLQKNNISTSADLVVRTSRDMFKIQGLNKRILFEVKDALRAHNMSLRVDENVSARQKKLDDAGNTDHREQNKPVVQDENRGTPKFGLADRRVDKPQKRAKQPEKLTEPLPQEEWRKVMKGGKWGFSDGFNFVIPAMYDEVFYFKEGLASCELNGKCGYIDGNNEVVIPFEYDTAMSFSEGYAMVVKGEKCGYINKNNEVVIPFEYDAATPFEEGEAKVKKDGKWATLTPDGKLVWI